MVYEIANKNIKKRTIKEFLHNLFSITVFIGSLYQFFCVILISILAIGKIGIPNWCMVFFKIFIALFIIEILCAAIDIDCIFDAEYYQRKIEKEIDYATANI